MPNIRLDHGESELWNEPGSRGDKFREAMRDRLSEEARVTKQVTEIINHDGKMVDAVVRADLTPDSAVNENDANKSPFLSIHSQEPDPKIPSSG
jgi:hypothetical protein